MVLKSVVTVEVVAAEWKVPGAVTDAMVVVAGAEYGAEESVAAEVAAEEATAEVTAEWVMVAAAETAVVVVQALGVDVAAVAVGVEAHGVVVHMTTELGS